MYSFWLGFILSCLALHAGAKVVRPLRRQHVWFIVPGHVCAPHSASRLLAWLPHPHIRPTSLPPGRFCLPAECRSVCCRWGISGAISSQGSPKVRCVWKPQLCASRSMTQSSTRAEAVSESLLKLYPEVCTGEFDAQQQVASCSCCCSSCLT